MAARLAIIVILVALTASPAIPVQAAPNQQPASSPCAVAVAAALAQQGKPYVWGAKGPNSFDCSGLTQYAWLQAGINIGPSTYNQQYAGIAIPCRLSDINGTETTCWQPGDLIFLRYQGGQHVAIYVGNGLFADAYNTNLGVIVHNPRNDNFYNNNFWQARRIVDCGETSIDVPDFVNPSPDADVSIEQIPDFLGYITFAIPQCGTCNIDGSTLLAAQPWNETWPEGFEFLDLPRVFRVTISWLAWQISEIVRQLICWLLTMLSIAASFFAGGINAIIAGINGLWRVLVMLLLAGNAQFLSLWALIDSARNSIALSQILDNIQPYLLFLVDVVLLFVNLIGGIISIFGNIAFSVIGVVGWVGSFVLSFFAELNTSLTETSAPAQLSETHIVYFAIRGALEGIRDSAIGWVFVVLWAMCYVAFVFWLNKFLSASNARD